MVHHRRWGSESGKRSGHIREAGSEASLNCVRTDGSRMWENLWWMMESDRNNGLASRIYILNSTFSFSSLGILNLLVRPVLVPDATLASSKPLWTKAANMVCLSAARQFVTNSNEKEDKTHFLCSPPRGETHSCGE